MALVGKAFIAYWTQYDFFPVCMVLFILRPCDRVKHFPQSMLQYKVSPICEISCVSLSLISGWCICHSLCSNIISLLYVSLYVSPSLPFFQNIATDFTVIWFPWVHTWMSDQACLRSVAFATFFARMQFLTHVTGFIIFENAYHEISEFPNSYQHVNVA